MLLLDYSPVYEYDPAADTWARKIPMSSPSGLHASSAVNGKIASEPDSWFSK
jgi:hypothetical protein